MRLLKLKIEDYKLFKPIDIDFKDSKHISVFIGKNGSGKTTLVKALTHIFSNLFNAQDLKDLNKVKFPFHFSITYLLRREKINQTSYGGEFYTNYIGIEITYKEKLEIVLYEGDKKNNGISEIEKNLHAKGESIKYILPDNLAVYYSGISDTIYNVFSEFQKKILFGSLTGDIKFDQPFYYFVPDNFPSILIALLSFEYGDIPDYLYKQFNITGFSEIVLNFKKPAWAKAKTTSDTFWGAMGELNQFLNILKGASKPEFKTDSISFTINSKSQLEQIWSYYGTEKYLFEYLVSLQANDLIDSIDLTLLKGDLKISYQDLSEGEKQLLIIRGIKELLAAENSLFLLDEPDTYLHPKWKKEFVYNLFDEYNDLDKSYSIITTHSPNIISALEKGQLKILVNENDLSSIKEVSFNPYGKPVDDILLEFFDVESLRYKKVQEKLDDIWSLIRSNKYDTSEFQKLFFELEKSIGHSDKAITDIKIEIAKRKKFNEKN